MFYNSGITSRFSGKISLVSIYYITFDTLQINCTQVSHCEFEFGMTPIPVSEENSVAFHLHLNILGEQKVMNGPVEIGESISIQCLEPGKHNTLDYLRQRK